MQSKAITATGTQIAGQAGKKIAVYAVALTLAAAGTAQFLSDDTALSGAISFDANGGLVLPNTGNPYFTTSVGDPLVLTTTVAVAGFLTYRII